MVNQLDIQVIENSENRAQKTSFLKSSNNIFIGDSVSTEVQRAQVKDEKELESLLVDDLDELEEGMRFLGRQIATDSGSLDILAVDKEGMLVVIELKVRERDEQLFQGIRYFD